MFQDTFEVIMNYDSSVDFLLRVDWAVLGKLFFAGKQSEVLCAEKIRLKKLTHFKLW
jgi:hypothetical protein